MNRFVQAPHHGGGYRSGQPTLIVIHSLEAPARRGLAWDLANGWIQSEQVSPHSMTDPGETVDLLDLGTVGWHCGNGNQVGIGLEVTGYAAWDFGTWTAGDNFAAVRLDAKRAAEVAAQLGIPHRWLSLQQVRAGESGFCTHADISLTLGGTNHTDPGPGFPYAIFMQMVNEWAGTGDAGSTPPRVPTGTTGGAQPKRDEDDMFDTVQRINPDTGKPGGPFVVAGPGYWQPVPTMEYYNVLQGKVIKPVRAVNAREWDLLKSWCSRTGVAPGK